MKRLLESMRKRIKENKYGNIEPIIITQDKVIVSGHQRVRVFKELKIPTIEAEIRIYKSEDDVLLDLLESNIRRRGEIGDSAKKVGKRIKELRDCMEYKMVETEGINIKWQNRIIRLWQNLNPTSQHKWVYQ